MAAASDEVGPAGQGGELVRYGGEEWIAGVPSRLELVEAHDPQKKRDSVRRLIDAEKPIFFMPTYLDDTVEYSGRRQSYILRLYGALITGEKAEVRITDVDVYFDIRVPPQPGEGRGGCYEKDIAELGMLASRGDSRCTAFTGRFRQILKDCDVGAPVYEEVWAYPQAGYYTEKQPFCRVHFDNLADRKKAISAIRHAGYNTASDDLTCYFRKAARELDLPTADWACLSNYEHTPGPTEASPLCSHTFRLPSAGYRAFSSSNMSKKVKAQVAAARTANPLLAHDRTLVMCWDTETHSETNRGALPVPERAGDNIFMICVTVHWKDDPAPLYSACLVDVECAPDPRWTTIVCGSYENIIRGFALVFRELAPDIILGFNDSGYDWPFLVKRARDFGVLPWLCNKITAAPTRRGITEKGISWAYRDVGQVMKIGGNSESIRCFNLRLPGYEPMDVRAVLKKLFPKSEEPKAASSLKWYLALCGLPSKADMPIEVMWRSYGAAREARPGTPAALDAAERMRHVAHYCVIDARRCQELSVRLNAVSEGRERAAISYLPLRDDYCYAIGLKVSNFYGSMAYKKGILLSMATATEHESGKYPGAFVFRPEKGLSPNPDLVANIERAAAALREAVARENAARGTAASGETRAETEEHMEGGEGPAESLESKAARAIAAALPPGLGVKELKMVLDRAFAAFASERPLTGLDFNSLYPSIIIAYNLSREKMLTDEEQGRGIAEGRVLHRVDFVYNGRPRRGWCVRHDGRQEEMGLFPLALLELMARRAEAKVILAELSFFKETAALAFSCVKAGATLAEAVRRVESDAQAEADQLAEKLAEGGPPLAIPPGSTHSEVVADMRRMRAHAERRVQMLQEVEAKAAPARDCAETKDAGIVTRRASDSELESFFQAEYARVSFQYICIDIKQKAIKLLMNSFYGVSGDQNSPLFFLLLAGGVTSAGQCNILMMDAFVRSLGWYIKYGDTDSLYVLAPAAYFAECDAAFAEGRLTRTEWMAAMVRITFRAVDTLRGLVNKRLREDNGTDYLKMAFEEVLYPYLLTGKKKYYGIAHVNTVNFTPDELFVRGIEVIKQGQTEQTRAIGYRIMWASVKTDNTRGILTIVKDVLADAILNDGQWGFEDFVRSSSWRPHRDNKPNHRFMARMRIRRVLELEEVARAVAAGRDPPPSLYEEPEPGSRFKFIIAPLGSTHDLRGLKRKAGNGDRMEYVHAAQALNIKPDVAFYISHYVAGVCARFVNGCPEFAPPASVKPDAADATAQKLAVKALKTYIAGLRGVDAVTERRRGVAYRRAYKRAAAQGSHELQARLGPAACDMLQGPGIGYEVLLGLVAGPAPKGGEPEEPAFDLEDEEGDGDNLQPLSAVDEIWRRAGTAAARLLADEDIPSMGPFLGIAPDGSDVDNPQRATRLFELSAVPTRGRPGGALGDPVLAAASEARLRQSISALLPTLAGVAERYEADLERLVSRERRLEHEANGELGAASPADAGEEIKASGAGEAAEEKADRAGGAEDAVVHFSTIRPADREPLGQLRALWFEAVGVQLAVLRKDALTAWLKGLRQKRLGVTRAPVRVPGATVRLVGGLVVPL